MGNPLHDTPALQFWHSITIDLVLGDVSFTNLTLLINGGSAPNTNSAMISQDNSFPSNTIPVNLKLFPAAFYLDVDFDGIKDLVVSGNAKNISQNETSVYFYKNTGANNAPNFNFQSKSFLQEEMIEHGLGSYPVIADVNNDGLQDLIIGNFFQAEDAIRDITL